MNQLPRSIQARRRQGGVALLEALLAAVLLAIGLLGTIGLQARSYAALSDAGMRAEATIAANKLLGIMNTDLDHLTAYGKAAGAQPSVRLAQWHAETVRLIPGASVLVAVTPAAGGAPAAVDITISWRRKADTPLNTHRISAYFAGST
jgi:type IV pilus assembly protein PilV